MSIYSWNAFAAELECEYASAFQTCKIAQQNGSSRSIKNPICTSKPSNEAILDQIILDSTFREIDDEINQYLGQLASQKDAYFGPNKQDDVSRAIDDVTKNLSVEGVYYKKYKTLCNGGILAERIKCSWSIPNLAAAPLLDQDFDASSCMSLVNFKMDVYKKVAMSTLIENKVQVQADSHKKYTQEQRTKYDGLLSMMQTIVGHIGRLARGVTHWTPDPL